MAKQEYIAYSGFSGYSYPPGKAIWITDPCLSGKEYCRSNFLFGAYDNNALGEGVALLSA